jgi:hypothetical protein
MEIWKVEACGDVVYINAENLTGAKVTLKAIMGEIPASLLKWTKVEELPEGEEFL